MANIQLTDLKAFVAVAEHRSFTKAAARIGISLPTVSQTIRALEEQIGVRLFNRTTRSVALTEAGEQFLSEVLPILQGIEHALESVNLFRDKPMGLLRLTVTRPYATMVLAPFVRAFLEEYPAIRLEVYVGESLSDIVGERFDAGIQVGHHVERDMTILRMSDEFRLQAVAAPAYVKRHGKPREPKDLYNHNCITMRLRWDHAITHWPFMKGGRQVEIAAAGNLSINDPELALSAVLDGAGVGYLPDTFVAPHIADGRLVPLLSDWGRNIDGIFLYHPSRRQTPAPLSAFMRFIEKHRAAMRS